MKSKEITRIKTRCSNCTEAVWAETEDELIQAYEIEAVGKCPTCGLIVTVEAKVLD